MGISFVTHFLNNKKIAWQTQIYKLGYVRLTSRFVLILNFFTRLFLPKNIYTEDLKKKKHMKFIGDCGLKTEKKFEKTYIRQ